MKIAVLYGGTSAEREVSLSSGKGVIDALKQNGHDVIGIDFNPERLEEVLSLDVDLVFIGLHGRFGEDGRIQGLLEMLNIPYVGSGVLSSALAMDKAKSKRMFEKAGIEVAKDITLKKDKFKKGGIEYVPFDYPVVVKPVSEGSTIGISIANDEKQLLDGIELAFQHDDEIMIEEFVSGKEVTVAVLGNQALPVIEIVPKNKYYDYESKYLPGMSEHIIPARVNKETLTILEKNAVNAHQALGCRTYSRADFIVPEDGGDPIILEVNTLPGMTPTSLFPDAAKHIGLSYNEMIEKLIQLSIHNLKSE